MNKKIALVGVVILVIGIALLAVGTLELQANTHHSNTYTLYSSGKYVSDEINVTSNATLTITNAPATMGLVTAANMPSVTNSTLSTVEIQPLATALGAHAYQIPKGNYYVVYFGNAAPSNQYTYLYTSAVTTYGIPTSVGLFVAIAGGIVAIVGVVLKKKQQPQVPQ